LLVILSEIGHESEIHSIEQRAFKERADAPEQECVQVFAMDIVGEHTIIGLDVAMHSELISAVRSREQQSL